MPQNYTPEFQKLYQSGHAIWWYTAPAIIWTFLEDYDFTGKMLNGNFSEAPFLMRMSLSLR